MNKSGLSIIALVITVVLLSILLTSLILSFDDAQTIYVIKEKEELITAIRSDIIVQKRKSYMNNGEDMSYSDIISIVQKYGEYNPNDMSITKDNNAQVFLYDIIKIPIEEFVNITYQQNTCILQSDLTQSGYIIEYKTVSAPWRVYVSPITMQEDELIYIRLKNPESQVISYEFILDNLPPSVTISPNGIGYVKNTNITINVVDNGMSGLSSQNVYEYYLSTSSTQQLNGTWLPYANQTAFNIGKGLTGRFYVHVRQVSDNSHNATQVFVSEPYIFDNTKPNQFIPALSDSTENSITIEGNTTDNSGQAIAYYYSINNGSTWQTGNSFTGLTPGTTYNQIKMKAEDIAGNVRITQAISVTTDVPQI